MIVAVILADTLNAPYLEPKGDAVIERVASTVLRGPFGGTLVASRPEIAAKIKDALHGFAVQHVDTSAAKTGAHGILIEALNAAAAFRSRWENARAAAAERFEKQGKSGDWAKHKQSADVKIRGLARSFDRDGVLVVPGDAIELKPEHLARMVEAFARDGQAPRPHAFAQAIFAGARGWPVVMTLDAAREVSALPAETVLAEWLLTNVERVTDVGLDA